MAQDFLDYLRIIEKGNHPHLLLADRALQWVDMPRLADEVPPLSGWEFPGRRRRAGREGFEFGELGFEVSAGPTMPGAFAGAATHLVGVETVVPDHLHTLVGNVLRQNGEEVNGVEDLKVAIDLRIELGSVDYCVGGGFQRYFLHRKRIAQDVLTELLAFGAVLRRDGAAGVHVESGVFPGFHPGHQFRRDEFVVEQFGEDLVRPTQFRQVVDEVPLEVLVNLGRSIEFPRQVFRTRLNDSATVIGNRTSCREPSEHEEAFEL